MIRPLLYLLAGLLMAPALALVGSLWLVAVGVPDALDAWPDGRVLAALLASMMGMLVLMVAAWTPGRRRRRRTTLPVADQTGEKR